MRRRWGGVLSLKGAVGTPKMAIITSSNSSIIRMVGRSSRTGTTLLSSRAGGHNEAGEGAPLIFRIFRVGKTRKEGRRRDRDRTMDRGDRGKGSRQIARRNRRRHKRRRTAR